MEVIKRDGRTQDFDVNKIKFAIERAGVTEGTNGVIDAILYRVVDKYNKTEQVPIEDLQGIIVKVLRKNHRKQAKLYKEYADNRTKIRDSKINNSYYNRIFELINGVSNDTSTENSNKDAKQMHVIRDLIAGELSKKMYREHVMPAKLMDLHDKGIIHVHDCDYRLQPAMSNCGLVNLEDVLQNGTVMNGKMIEKPHSLKTAANIATQVVAAVGSSQYGGITFTMTHLAPFVRISSDRIYKRLKDFGLDSETLTKLHDKMLSEEIEESIQTINYQLNTMSTTNGQSPFITIFCYADEDPEYKNETVLLIEELFRQRIKGMKSPSGHVINPTFPKIVYVLTESNLDPKSEDFKTTYLAAQCTCKRMVPDYMSEKKAKEYKEGCVIPPMGCRSFLSPWKNSEGKYQIYGRMNTGVISVNLPYIALSSDNIDDFYTKLEELVVYICEQQKKIYDCIGNSKIDIAPILWKYGVYGRATEGTIKQCIDNLKCSVSVGYMGIAEAVERFGVHYNTKKGHKLGLAIIKKLADIVSQQKDKLGISLGLYGTPAESLTTKFARACKKFDVIEHVNDRDYITNSYHIPVETEIDGFSKIDFEAEFQRYSHNGAISYIEMPDIKNNPEAVVEVLRHIYDKIMYCEINTTGCSTCYACGYEGEMKMGDHNHFECPNCGNTNPELLNIIYRTCGYLGEFSHGTSKGRWEDIKNRVKHF